jgi:hypothetical protein
MARFTQGGGSGDGSALNYVQVAGTQVTVSSAPATIINLDITTTGKPVQISVTGEGSNASAGSWVRVNLFRGNTAIGNEIQIEASDVSENVPYAINFIDDVAAGTYNYSARVTTKSSGNWTFGEVAGPVINAVELTGFKGDTGAQGPQGEPGVQGEPGEGADIADFIFTDNGTESTVTLPGDKDMNLSSGTTSDIFLIGGHDAYLTGGRDVFIESVVDDIHLGSNDDITLSTNINDPLANHSWRLNSEGGLVFPDNTVQTTAFTGVEQGLVYLGNYILGNGYIANIAVVRGSDNNLYIAKSSGGLGDPVGNTAEWDIFSDNTAGSADIADFVFTNVDENNSSITVADDKEVTIESGETSDLNVRAGDQLWLTSGNDVILQADDNMQFRSQDSTEIMTNFVDQGSAEHVWEFTNTGTIVFPDATIQSTAYTGGAGGDLVIPFIMKDENGNDLLGFEKGGTGVTRINALQDDLALRSSNDIILYPGDDGPGNVYINWGDATISPNATNRVATIADIQSANTGDITFVDSTISNNTGDDIVIQNTDINEVVKARITLDQGNEQVLIEAINTNSNTFTTADWTTATWSSNVIQITGTENGVIPFFSNVSGNVTHIQVNGGDLVQYDGASYGATDLTMYTMQNAPVGSDPVTITSLTLISGVSSKINIDYDGNDFQINANGMAIDMSSTDDITITAGGDDLRLRSWDDTIFTAGYNNNTQYEWRMNNNGRFELPASGYIENLNGASSDGNNNDVLHLVPDFNLVDDGSDQYLIIEPTFGSPNHLHLRPGGTIDESDTDIILGGERNSVHISDTDKAVIVSTAYRTEKTYTNISNESGTSFIALSSADIAVGYTVNVDGIDYQVSEVNPFDEGLVAVVAGSAVFQAEGMYTFVNNADYENYWTFRSDGVLSGPAMGSVRVSSIMNAGADDLGFYANDADIDIQANAGSISLNSQYINLNANDDATISSSGGDHDWVFNSNGVLYGPAEDSHIEVAGIRGENGHPTMFIGPDSIVLDGNNGEFLNDPSNPDNQIARIADLTEDSGTAFQSVQWTPNFEATGLVFSGSGATYPTYNSYYVKQGQLVSFWITIDLSTVTNFGTGQLKTALPFAPLAGTMNHFSGWVFVDETANPDLAGHIILNADHLSNTTVLDLHYIKQQGGANSPVMEAMLIQGTPVTLTTNTNIYINGTYIAAS